MAEKVSDGLFSSPEPPAADVCAQLEPGDVDVYRFFLESPATVPECCTTVDMLPAEADKRILRLSERRLLRPSLTDPDKYEAVSPELAAAELAAPMQARAHQLMLDSEAVRRELSTLSSMYRASQRKYFAYASTEVLVDGDRVRQRLKDLPPRCRAACSRRTRPCRRRPRCGPGSSWTGRCSAAGSSSARCTRTPPAASTTRWSTCCCCRGWART